MGSPVIVEGEEFGESLGALGGGWIGAVVGPAAQECLDEAFGFSVGARAVGAGAKVAQAQPSAGGGEVVGDVARAIVGHDAGDFDSVAVVPGDQASKEGGSGRFLRVEVLEPGETLPSQDTGHRGRAQADARGDLGASLPPPAQSKDLFDNNGMGLPRTTMGPRTAIDQRRLAGLLITSFPFRRSSAVNTGRLGGAGHGHTGSDPLNQKHSTGRASSGILVKLHLGSFVETVALNTSSLTDLGPDGQLPYGNNVLRNHT